MPVLRSRLAGPAGEASLALPQNCMAGVTRVTGDAPAQDIQAHLLQVRVIIVIKVSKASPPGELSGPRTDGKRKSLLRGLSLEKKP